MKYNQIKLGDQTNHGIVKHIYGAAEDYIVFMNEDDDPKCLSNRTDAVYNEATRIARELSAKALKNWTKSTSVTLTTIFLPV